MDVWGYVGRVRVGVVERRVDCVVVVVHCMWGCGWEIIRGCGSVRFFVSCRWIKSNDQIKHTALYKNESDFSNGKNFNG